jgi:hypothetical protein
MGAIYSVVGHDVLAVGVCQAVLGSISCALTLTPRGGCFRNAPASSRDSSSRSTRPPFSLTDAPENRARRIPDEPGDLDHQRPHCVAVSVAAIVVCAWRHDVGVEPDA